MKDFFMRNSGTIITAAIIAAAAVLIITGMIKDKRKGKSSCGCSCGCCSNSELCHDESKNRK